MTDIGTLAISMGLDIAELRKDSARAKKDIKDMSRAMERDINRVNKNFERMSDRFSKDISQLKRSVASLERQMDKMSKSTERSFNRTNKAVKNSSTVFNGFVKTVRAAALGYATVLATMEITQFTSGILKQGVALDSLQRSYKAITGSAEESNRILNMLGKTANDLGLNLNAVEDSYRNILAASKNTALEGQAIEKVFMSVVKASAVLGMSADDTAGTLRALSQMISKGNVQAEELRGQLGERLPGAFQMAAEAMGVSTQQLNKMLEQGQVLASDLLPKLADVLENRFGEAAEDAGKRAGASFERLSNSVIQLQRTLATSGILDLFVELADSISSLLNDSQDDIEKFMESLNFEEGIENVLALASAFGKLYKVITFGGGIGKFAGYVNALTDEFFTMLDGAKVLAEGQITWDEFLGSGNEINAAVDRWKEGEKAIIAFKDAVENASEEGSLDIQKLANSFDKPREAIQYLENQIKELKEGLSFGAFGVKILSPSFSADLAKIREAQEDIKLLQEILDYGFEVETLERLGNSFGFIAQKAKEAMEQAESFKKVDFEVNMGGFVFDSKTRDKELKAYESRKKMLGDFINYSKSKYDEERDKVNETFRQLYVLYKDDKAKREQLREALSKRLQEIDDEETANLKEELLKRIDMTRTSYKQMYDNIKAFNEEKEKVSSVVSDYTSTPFQKELAAEKAKYKEMIAYAKKWDLDVQAVKDQHKENVVKLYKEESDRYRKEQEDQVKAAKKAAQEKLRIQQELDLELIANLDAVNYTEKERRMQIDKDLVEQTRKILKDRADLNEKAREDKIKAEEKAAAEIEKDWERVYDDMHKFAADTFYDIFDGQLDSFSDFADSMFDIFKRMLANMAAEAAMTNIFKPIMQKMAGSALGNMFGLPGSGGGSGFGGGLFNNIGKLFSGNISDGMFGDLGRLFGIGGSQMGITGSGVGYSSYGIPASHASQMGNIGSQWSSGIGSAVAMAPFAALAAFVAPKLIASLFGDKPQATFQSSSDPYSRMLEHNATFDRDIGPYTYQTQTKLGQKSQNFDYWVRWKDVDDPEAQQAVYDFFDSRFTAYEELFEISMNNVLKDSSFMAGTGRLDKGGTMEDMFSGVFENVLPALLTAVFPDSDTITQEFQKGFKSVPNPDYSGTRMDFDNKVPEEILVPDMAERQISVYAEKFNEAFFKAIMPEDGSEFDAFIEFGQVVQNTEDFMAKFNRQINEFSESTISAYENIKQITGVMSSLQDMHDAVFQDTTLEQQLQSVIAGFSGMIDVLEEAHATTEELAKAEKQRNELMGAAITGINAQSVKAGLQAGKTGEQAMADIVSQAIMDYTYDLQAQTIIEAIQPTLDQIGADFQENLDAGMSNVEAAAKALEDAGYAQQEAEEKELSGWGSGIYDEYANRSNAPWEAEQERVKKAMEERQDAMESISGMMDSVMGLKFSGSQMKVQGILSDLEELFGHNIPDFMISLAESLAVIQGLDIYRGQLQDFGDMWANIFGLQDEFREAQIYAKYDKDFLDKAAYMSATEFISAVDGMGMEVSEVGSDLVFLADILKETAREFEAVNKSVTATKESLIGSNRSALGGGSMESLMRQFNAAAGMAMSADAGTATIGAQQLSEIANPLLAAALREAPTSYEYNKVYGAMIRKLEDVERYTEDQAKLTELGEPDQQLKFLKSIADDISTVDTTIDNMLTGSTFQSYVTKFDAAMGETGIWGKLNSNVFSLAEAIGKLGLIGNTDLPTNKRIDTVDAGQVPVVDNTSLLSEISGRYNLSMGQITNGFSDAYFGKMNIKEKISFLEEMSSAYGLPQSTIQEDLGYLRSIGYADGGIASGPMSGYAATLHGTEAIIPLNGGAVPLKIEGLSNAEVIAELKELRKENKFLLKQNNDHLKKISNFYRTSRNDDGTALRVETV